MLKTSPVNQANVNALQIIFSRYFCKINEYFIKFTKHWGQLFFYLCRFSESRSSSGFTASNQTSVCPSVYPSILQTLHNDCSYIEDVHLLFNIHFLINFSFLGS